MSETATEERASAEPEKPVGTADVKFPPYPEPTDDDFDEDVSEEEKAHYKSTFSDLNNVVTKRLHCTACDRHLGCSALNESRMKLHPMLRTLICNTCHSFYNSGEFDKGEDGSELYCRWCGQGGQVYCCSDCIHVFCAKCIKRNFGLPKIKEIENTDDWKCFKCNPNCLFDLRALCWALLRYCDLRNKFARDTEDVETRQAYAKLIAVDNSECCRSKARKSIKSESAKKKDKEKIKAKDAENMAKTIISKIPPTIQVKKFASVNLDDFNPKLEKKAQKRPASPKSKAVLIKNPIAIAPCPIIGPKKVRMQVPTLYSPIRFGVDKKVVNLTRVPRPRIMANNFNGYPSPGLFNPMSMNNMNTLPADNINLSLDSLTQGLDFAAVQALNNSQPSYGNNSSVVCTPDFPMEPLCEVTEDNDDDVECITPGPVVTPINPPPLTPARSNPTINLPKGVIQMTDSDVTVNALTGGLKFRVDPQTLSSNKMYRLPDGRIFAINSNPNMPGGYSATIVSQNSDGTPKVTPRSETFAAKLSAVSMSSPKVTRTRHITPKRKKSPKKTKKSKSNKDRDSDLKVPVEWFRYNVIDAVDALEYSLSRLHKLKKETPSSHLRTRTVDEMKYVHRTLEQLLTTSSKRFIEIRDTLNKEMKQYLSVKSNKNKDKQNNSEDEEDDDVEILPNIVEDPIFIDEHSLDSINANETHEVDLTGAASSEHNDSAENRNNVDALNTEDVNNLNDDSTNSAILDDNDNGDALNAKELLLENQDENDKMETDEPVTTSSGICDVNSASDPKSSEMNGGDSKNIDVEKYSENNGDESTETSKDGTENNTKEQDSLNEKKVKADDKQDIDAEEAVVDLDKEHTDKKADQDSEKYPDTDMSEEMIETLLKDDNLDENASMEISDLQEAEHILS